MSKLKIVKVQTSAQASPMAPEVLVYAENRFGLWQTLSNDLYNAVGGPLGKKYFYGKWKGNHWTIDVSKEAPEQNW